MVICRIIPMAKIIARDFIQGPIPWIMGFCAYCYGMYTFLFDYVSIYCTCNTTGDREGFSGILTLLSIILWPILIMPLYEYCRKVWIRAGNDAKKIFITSE